MQLARHIAIVFLWLVSLCGCTVTNKPATSEPAKQKVLEPLLAFPGAEGYGRFAAGGRGGRVIEVTNLFDYDSSAGEKPIPGSFRAAVEAEGPRTVVFRVSGIINLKRPVIVKNSYLTVAGQTAPGDGICFRRCSVGVGSATNVIIRYIRIRVGDESGHPYDGAGLQGDNNIMDHCSISWSMDEGLSTRQAKNVTFQRCIISEALHDSWNYQPHSFAASIGGDVGSFHHNLLAHCAGRVWSLAGGMSKEGKSRGRLDIRNNVVYNWLHRNTDGGALRVNFVSNYYRPGPATRFMLLIDPDWQGINAEDKYYISGNILEERPQYSSDNWSGVPVDAHRLRSDTELFPSYVKTSSAQEAFDSVLADVGANRPRQDAVDKRIIRELREGTFTYTGSRTHLPGIIDTQADLGSNPWPEYKTYDVPTDSDHDGLPDWWEKKHNTNCYSPPEDFSDSNADSDGDGYTCLEDYLNYLAAGGRQEP
jgi:hypothetical protein